MPEQWLPYQKKNFVTLAFPGYVSGHSTFSRSAAEILTAVTGSQFFPGGMKTFTASSNTFLSFEKDPSQTIQLQWATYFDASDQAGLSRLWGGIHVRVDDLTGRRIGAQCGHVVWALAQKYFDGSAIVFPAVGPAESEAERGQHVVTVACGRFICGIPVEAQRKNELRIKTNNTISKNRGLWAVSCVVEKK